MRFNFKIDNKMLVKILLIGGGIVLLFVLGSMVNSWFLLVLAILGFLLFLGLSLSKDKKITELSNVELIKYLNSEQTVYNSIAIYLKDDKEITGALAITQSRICFVSVPIQGKEEKVVVDINISDIKEMPESNYLRLDTWQGMYLFKTDESKIIKELLNSKNVNIKKEQIQTSTEILENENKNTENK